MFGARYKGSRQMARTAVAVPRSVLAQTLLRSIFVLIAAAMLLLTTSCSEQARRSLPSADGNGSVPTRVDAGSTSGPTIDACTYGDKQECHLTVGVHNGIMTCLCGYQDCLNGQWGPCEGEVTSRPLPTKPGAVAPTNDSEAAASPSALRVGIPIRRQGVASLSPTGASGGSGPATTPMSLSTAAHCASDPCDPTCMVFDEQPPDPITAVGAPVKSGYSQGNVSDLPGGFQNKGLKDPNHPPTSTPCSSPADCQFDHRCDASTGLCVPWLAGETNPSCSNLDLTAGPTCYNTIPLCNRGQVEAPAGIKVAVFHGNSPQMQDNLGKCASGDIEGSKAGECVSLSVIKPGECINVSCPAGLLGGTQSIMVNPPAPPGSTSPVAECECANNWTVYHNGGSCEVASCSPTTATTKLQPVNMYILMDNSMSMASAGFWKPAKAAMSSFFKNPDAAGLNVALRFFGSDPVPGCDDTACSADACAVPKVSLGLLTPAKTNYDAQESLLVSTLDAQTTSLNGTPIYPAIGGLAKWATEYSIAHPGGQEIAVFLTDGAPYGGCIDDWVAIRKLASDAYDAQGVLTYVIGFPGANQTDLNALAAAGHTGTAFFIDTTNPVNLETALLNALDTIRGSTVACKITLPNASNIDPNDVTVTVRPAAGGTLATSQVSSLTACTGKSNEWYLDNNAAPTTILLCPAFCTETQAGSGAELDVTAGCPAKVQPVSYAQVYVGSCPPGAKVLWQYFTYNTVTPSDASIDFKGRTASAEAELDGPSTLLATAAASSNTQVCSMSGPAPCPVSFHEKLGPAAFAEYLEIVASFYGSSNQLATPKILDWQVTYSCPPME